MPIRLHDSLTRQPKELKPAQADGIFRFYNCGPTVYAPAHIGNFRTFVVNDVIRRLLELEFGKDKVKHVRNLTDVDDKTIKRARDEGRPLADVTKQWTEKFHADCAALNCLPPHIEPTATGHIKEQVDMIDVLMQKGNAYRAADGSVYFKVSSFDGYGSLSRVKERELQLGSALSGKSQAADADEKEDVSDFALWKAYKPDDGANAWESPWGRGRPGWHIECSAMSKKHLGDTIDLHTGGVDLLFPHHENELAQSECCNGTTFAHHWYHSEHLLVDGKKMSKSLGNLYTLDELVAKGFSPMALRYALLMGHPRKQLSFTLDSMHAAKSALIKLKTYHDWLEQYVKANDEKTEYLSKAFDSVLDHLRDDLNTPGALGALFSTLTSGAGDPAAARLAALKRILFVFGFNLAAVELHDQPYSNEVMELAEKLLQCRLNEDSDGALKYREQLLAQGLDMYETADGWTLRHSERIASLASKRWAAKQAKDWAGADALRKELTAAGWNMKDGKDGYTLEPLKK